MCQERPFKEEETSKGKVELELSTWAEKKSIPGSGITWERHPGRTKQSLYEQLRFPDGAGKQGEDSGGPLRHFSVGTLSYR